MYFVAVGSRVELARALLRVSRLVREHVTSVQKRKAKRMCHAQARR